MEILRYGESLSKRDLMTETGAGAGCPPVRAERGAIRHYGHALGPRCAAMT